MIFVFGSNLRGIHGAGAAKHAPFNCHFDSAWSWYLPEHKQWGTQ